MKTVYLVRHGESEANVGAPVFQGDTSPLTETGRRQAEFIGKRAENLKFDVLIASTAVRAQETARAISKVTGKPVEAEELFTERILPGGFIGKKRGDSEAEALLVRWGHGFFDDTIETGGENFSRIKDRAKKALAYLSERPEEHILVVTHGFFLRALLAFLVFGDSLGADEFKKFIKATRTDNTGITVLTYGAVPQHAVDPHEERWMIRVYNDIAHLG